MDASGERGETGLQSFFVIMAAVAVLLLVSVLLIGRALHRLAAVAPIVLSAVRIPVPVRIADRRLAAYRLIGDPMSTTSRTSRSW